MLTIPVFTALFAIPHTPSCTHTHARARAHAHCIYSVLYLIKADQWWCKVTLVERGGCTLQAELPIGYPSTSKLERIRATLGQQYPRSSSETIRLTAKLNTAVAAKALELDFGPSIFMLTSFVEEWIDDHLDELDAVSGWR